MATEIVTRGKSASWYHVFFSFFDTQRAREKGHFISCCKPKILYKKKMSWKDNWLLMAILSFLDERMYMAFPVHKKLWYWTSHWPWLSLLSRHHCKFGPNQGVLNSHLSPGPYAYCSWFTHDGRSSTLSGTLNTLPPSDSFCHIRLQSLSSLWTLNHISLRGS